MLCEVRPTIVLAVPRVFETLYNTAVPSRRGQSGKDDQNR
jgi:long-subunit acyl-CoA synthetase (AMP-forming)